MGFYAVLNEVDRLLVNRHWKLHRCRREAGDELHYYVMNADNRVLTQTTADHHFVTDNKGEALTPTTHRRAGLTLMELLVWMEQSGDEELSACARSARGHIEDAW